MSDDLHKRAKQEAAMLREIAQSQARGIDWRANLTATADFLDSLPTSTPVADHETAVGDHQTSGITKAQSKSLDNALLASFDSVEPPLDHIWPGAIADWLRAKGMAQITVTLNDDGGYEAVERPVAKPVGDHQMVERVACAVGQAIEGPQFDPHADPEAFAFAEEIARAAIAAMPR